MSTNGPKGRWVCKADRYNIFKSFRADFWGPCREQLSSRSTVRTMAVDKVWTSWVAPMWDKGRSTLWLDKVHSSLILLKAIAKLQSARNALKRFQINNPNGKFYLMIRFMYSTHLMIMHEIFLFTAVHVLDPRANMFCFIEIFTFCTKKKHPRLLVFAQVSSSKIGGACCVLATTVETEGD